MFSSVFDRTSGDDRPRDVARTGARTTRRLQPSPMTTVRGCARNDQHAARRLRWRTCPTNADTGRRASSDFMRARTSIETYASTRCRTDYGPLTPPSLTWRQHVSNVCPIVQGTARGSAADFANVVQLARADCDLTVEQRWSAPIGVAQNAGRSPSGAVRPRASGSSTTRPPRATRGPV